MSDAQKLAKELAAVDEENAKLPASKRASESELEAKKELIKERYQFEDEAEEYNKQQTGVGLRMLVGSTRGRSTINIKYLAFDKDAPDSLPRTVEKFVEVTGIKSNVELADMLIVGYIDKTYTEASDPIAEFVNKSWKPDVKTKFKTIVKGLVSTLPDMTIAKAVEMVRPGMDSLKDNFAS